MTNSVCCIDLDKLFPLLYIVSDIFILQQCLVTRTNQLQITFSLTLSALHFPRDLTTITCKLEESSLAFSRVHIHNGHAPFVFFRSEGPAFFNCDSNSFCCLLTALNNCTTVGGVGSCRGGEEVEEVGSGRGG